VKGRGQQTLNRTGKSMQINEENNEISGVKRDENCWLRKAVSFMCVGGFIFSTQCIIKYLHWKSAFTMGMSIYHPSRGHYVLYKE